jgi:hypothetical protein
MRYLYYDVFSRNYLLNSSLGCKIWIWTWRANLHTSQTLSLINLLSKKQAIHVSLIINLYMLFFISSFNKIKFLRLARLEMWVKILFIKIVFLRFYFSNKKNLKLVIWGIEVFSQNLLVIIKVIGINSSFFILKIQ